MSYTAKICVQSESTHLFETNKIDIIIQKNCKQKQKH